MSQLNKSLAFANDNGCILLRAILNNNPMSTSPHHIIMKCGRNVISIPVSVFTGDPYYVEINGEPKRITTWDNLRKEYCNYRTSLDDGNVV